ncbi:MAG: superoxide dismutase [Fe] [Alphaproteobacteria bacterium]|nr:superoxide dismutase [Fe] [Alphaproteobacteria bacterium]
MPITLPDLPYAQGALAPHISAQTLEFHHGKHHKAYVDKTNELIKGGKLDNAPLEEIVRAAEGEKNQALFNNSAQAWNHSFYWKCMKPGGGGAPTGDVARAIEKNFDGYDAFKAAFADAGATQFGSGWAWLVARKGKLEVRKTPNAQVPWTEKGVTPLLIMDVWEHAYYLDYQNRRPAYISSFLDNLVNWDFVNENLAKA